MNTSVLGRPERTKSSLSTYVVCESPLTSVGTVAAAAAFPEWRAVPVPERVQVLFRYKALLEREQEALAASVARENGKLLADARAEVRRGIEVVDFACGMPTLAQGRTAEGIARGIDSHTWRVPVGVVAGICPFNFPAMIPLWMFPIAVAAGNTFVLKPSERTPATGLRLAELLHEAGLPAGVLNVVHGGRDAVDALLDHPLVRARRGAAARRSGSAAPRRRGRRRGS